jgi:hypothetical protein
MNRCCTFASSLLLVFGAALAPLGCDAKPAPSAAGKADDHGHDHDHDHADHDHGDHDHAHEKGGDAAKTADEHSGETVKLGTIALSGVEITVSQVGAAAAGSEAHFDLLLAFDKVSITALRAWIGTEDAKGSTKSKADVHEGTAHLHAEVPSPLPADAKLWIEIEVEGQPKAKGAVELKK